MIGDEKRDNNVKYIGSPTTRVGLDGVWVGANHGKSYFFFPVDPGDHHLCVRWQSSFKQLSQAAAALSLTAEAGKVYYVRATLEERHKRQPAVKLEAVDDAEGQLLVASSAFSIAHPKK